MAQFNLQDFTKEQMVKDFNKLNTNPTGVKETIKEVIANAGSAVIQASILATNSIRIANNLVLEEVWDSQEELIKKISNRIEEAKQPSLSIKGVIMLKSIVVAVSSAVVVVATGYISLVGLIIATSMQQ